MSSDDAAAAAVPLDAAAVPAPAAAVDAAVPLAADVAMSDVPSSSNAAAEQITDTAAVTPASDADQAQTQAQAAPHAAAAAAAESPVAAAPAAAPAAPPAEVSDDSASTAAAMSDVAAADSSAQAEPAEAAPVDAAVEPAAAAAAAAAPAVVAAAAPAAAAAASDAAAAAPAAAQSADVSSSVPASPSQLQSPRKSGRAVHLTPKMEALAGQSALGSAALQLPPAAAAPSSSLFSSRDIWMTPHQAAIENKKMRAHCGWRFVPVAGAPKVTTLMQQVTGVDVNVGRQARPRTKHDDADADMPPATPTAGRKNSRQSVATTPATASKKGSKRKAGSGEFAPTGDPSLDDKQRQLAQLAEQIEALKNQEKSILSGTPLPSTPMAYPVTPVAAAAAAPPTPAEKKRKPNPPAPVAIPSTPTMARQSSVATPGMTPATPLGGVSRAGRNVKAPQHFADEQVEASSSARARTLSVHLKSCRKLLEHLAAHKASQGIFAVPVNYNDPSKMYYAPGYLETIGPTNRPMDLGTIRQKLVAFEYGTMHEFAADVRMVYRNAMLYNPENEWIHRAAADCMRIFEREIKRIADLPEKRAVAHHHHHHDEHGEEDEEEHAHRKSSKKQAKRTRELQQLRTSLPDMQTDLLEQMTARILALEAKLAQSQPAPASYSPPMKAAPSPAYRPERERAEPVSRPPPQPAARKPSTPSQKHQQPLSQHEKQQLKDDIFKLPSHKLGPVVEIISRAMPKSEQKDGENEDEIEIDIDKLDIPTLRELQLYVKKALAALKRTTPAARRPTGGGAPKSSPAARATPSAASPAHTSPFPRTSPAAHTMQSPSRLDMPSTPNLARGASQAVGSTTPALKYDSSSDDSDSDSSSSDDDDAPYASHLTSKPAAAADDTPAPAILDVERQTHSSDSDDDEADGNAPAWSNVPSTSLAPAVGAAAAAATPAVGSALWSAAQRSAEEAKAKSRALAELESRRAEEMEREKAALLSAGEERKRAAEAEEQARIAAEQRAIEEKRIKLEADREAARRARAARANQLSEANPSGIASGQADEMSEMERNL